MKTIRLAGDLNEPCSFAAPDECPNPTVQFLDCYASEPDADPVVLQPRRICSAHHAKLQAEVDAINARTRSAALSAP